MTVIFTYGSLPTFSYIQDALYCFDTEKLSWLMIAFFIILKIFDAYSYHVQAVENDHEVTG